VQSQLPPDSSQVRRQKLTDGHGPAILANQIVELIISRHLEDAAECPLIMPNGKQRDAIRTQALNFLLEVPKGTDRAFWQRAIQRKKLRSLIPARIAEFLRLPVCRKYLRISACVSGVNMDLRPAMKKNLFTLLQLDQFECCSL
jgi:hypothetical protein